MAGYELYEAMSTTRAVRRLRTDPVPDGAVLRVVRAATWAPTGGNAQPWRVIVLRDPAKKLALQKLYLSGWEKYSAGHRELLKSMVDEHRKPQERMLAAADHLARHFHEAPVILMFCFNPSLLAITDAALDRPSIVGGASVYPAVQNALLACRAEGLGCTLTTLLCAEEPRVKELLGIPEEWATAAAVPIGYPVGTGHGPLVRRAPEQMAYADTWGERLPEQTSS
jgi:nitroreductase